MRACAWNGEFLDDGNIGNCAGLEGELGRREDPRRKGGRTVVGGDGEAKLVPRSSGAGG